MKEVEVKTNELEVENCELEKTNKNLEAKCKGLEEVNQRLGIKREDGQNEEIHIIKSQVSMVFKNCLKYKF